jgi:hypothetical protein
MEAMSMDDCDHWMGPLHYRPEKCPRCEIDRLKAQLWKYGKHLAACALWKSMAAGCDCGWVDVRATLAPVKPRPDDAFNASIAPTPSGDEKHG